MALSKNFQYSLKKFGEPITYANPTDAELASWSGIVPEPLIDFWRLYGWTSFLKGQLWLPNPRDFDPLMETLFAGDPQIDYRTCHLIAYSAFGSLYIWSEEFNVINLELPHGWVLCGTITANDPKGNLDNLATFPFFGDIKTAYNSVDEDSKPLYSRAVKKYGALEPGECFGFVPALVLGGSGNLDEIKRVKALEHFIFIAQLQPLTLMKWEGTNMMPVREIGGG